ncbi:MAG: MBL fold metallo-hydrolase [Ilumatobacteraceae bacterium]|nr:MBL fold metallo-hydrolase [Ilumatobacteraceae bacterium]
MPPQEHAKDATQHTQKLNAQVVVPNNRDDFDNAQRGFIAQWPGGRVEDAKGRMVYDISRYEFIAQGSPSPSTVNPSLWRQAQLNVIHGLFEVAPNVWQVRGYDLSNITFIAGDTGWVVIDPLTNENTARISLELANQHLGARPVTAVIYTHSHVDHFGGVLGVTTQAEVDAGKCRVIAPEGFLHETVSENVIAGPAMARRSGYQFGSQLPAAATGHVDSGLGKSVPLGASGLIAPTEDITHTGEELVVDGVRIVFQLTPETEAPAEMNFFFPDHGWLCMAENCTHTMHNLVPIRGAQVRDALSWSKYINESIELFGENTSLMFASHHWPRWGNTDIVHFLTLQRDLYRWMHDQTMRLANHGYVASEIAEMLSLPEDFLEHSHTRGYYGDLVHNVKAVYQRYLSWYDANPSNLHKLPPSDAGKKYVELAGGEAALLLSARSAFERGEYRWVAELLNHLVFANPENAEARHLQADTFEQLGYQAESSTFRNSYLMGAQELREGPPSAARTQIRAKGILMAMTIQQVFDTLAIRLKTDEVAGVALSLNWTFTDINEQWLLGISHRTLFSTPGRHDPQAAATITTTRRTLLEVISQSATFLDEIQAGNISIEGDATALITVLGNLDTFQTNFAIVEP